MLRVVCVLKSGGYYTPDHVNRLERNVASHLTVPHVFVCLTDTCHSKINGVCIPLANCWDGWWSKMELFLFRGSVLYFDLDTLIINNIDSYAEYILSMNSDTLLCLEGFVNSTYGKLMSGVMGWNCDLTYVYDVFQREAQAFMRRYRGDQNVIEYLVRREGIEPRFIQRELDGLFSYKRSHIRKEGLKGGERVVCFHGNPRPENCREEWVQNVLKKGEV